MTVSGFSSDAVSLNRKAGADTLRLDKAEFQSSACPAPEPSVPFLWFPGSVSPPHTREGEPGAGIRPTCWQVDTEFTLPIL